MQQKRKRTNEGRSTGVNCKKTKDLVGKAETWQKERGAGTRLGGARKSGY